MLFTELYKIMVNKVTFIGFWISLLRRSVHSVCKRSTPVFAVVCNWQPLVWWDIEACHATFQYIYKSKFRTTGGTIADSQSTAQEIFWKVVIFLPLHMTASAETARF